MGAVLSFQQKKYQAKIDILKVTDKLGDVQLELYIETFCEKNKIKN